MLISAKTKGINASELKYIAILAMLIDHIAWLFVPTAGAAGQAMHLIGRVTAPVMCFFISEGYHYTKNLRRYFIRMCIFAVISHFAYAFCFNGGFFEKGTESVIATLTLSLLSVHVINSDKIIMALKMPLIMLLVYFAEGCDWGAAAIMFTLTFELARGSRKKQLIAYSVSAFVYVLPTVNLLFKGYGIFLENVYKFGVFLPVPLLMLYNGEKGGGKYTKWVFYIFYPAHLILLQYINLRYT